MNEDKAKAKSAIAAIILADFDLAARYLTTIKDQKVATQVAADALRLSHIQGQLYGYSGLFDAIEKDAIHGRYGL